MEKVQIIVNSLETESLISRGEISSSGPEKTINLYGKKIEIPEKEEINTGIFECSAGTYKRSVKSAEIMHILNGKGSFSEDGKKKITFNPGDTLFFAENTEGEWVIETTMRKVYVILP